MASPRRSPAVRPPAMTRTGKANIAAADHASLGGARRASPIPSSLTLPRHSARPRAPTSRPRTRAARPSSRTDHSPRASPRRRPPRRRTPRGAPNAMVRRIRRVPGACAACDRARRPALPIHPTFPSRRQMSPRPTFPVVDGRATRLAPASGLIIINPRREHPDTLIRPGDSLCVLPPGSFSPLPPSHLCSPPPRLSPTNCCARCGPWCPPLPATSSRTRTSSPGFFSSGCARNSFEAPNSPPRAVNPRGSSPAAANTAKGVT